MRYNGQYLDLNRDYTKLESPEVRALVGCSTAWDPVLVVDMHTTNGSYHREPVTYTTGGNPNGPRALADYMWEKLFPAVAATPQEALRLGQRARTATFADGEHPEKGWENDSLEARYGTNYVGAAQPAHDPRRELLLRRLQDPGAVLATTSCGRCSSTPTPTPPSSSRSCAGPTPRPRDGVLAAAVRHRVEARSR